ncbi:hypothetical protein CXF86_22000 [Shewanella sp. GutCb]|nr:hypothetical protein CXF86_22000 [Shewanella sp. GutCb]
MAPLPKIKIVSFLYCYYLFYLYVAESMPVYKLPTSQAKALLLLTLILKIKTRPTHFNMFHAAIAPLWLPCADLGAI